MIYSILLRTGPVRRLPPEMGRTWLEQVSAQANLLLQPPLPPPLEGIDVPFYRRVVVHPALLPPRRPLPQAHWLEQWGAGQSSFYTTAAGVSIISDRQVGAIISDRQAGALLSNRQAGAIISNSQVGATISDRQAGALTGTQ